MKAKKDAPKTNLNGKQCRRLLTCLWGARAGGGGLGPQGANVPPVRQPAGTRGRGVSSAAMEPRCDQPDGDSGVDRPHKRDRRHLRHPRGCRSRRHSLPPSAGCAAAPWRLDPPGPQPLESIGTDAISHRPSTVPPLAADYGRSECNDSVQVDTLLVKGQTKINK